VIKTFVKIGVGIRHTETGGKILRRGYENGARALRSAIRGAGQHGVELRKEWIK
jgi:hypothetical protein